MQKTQIQVGGAIMTAAVSAISSALNAFNFAPQISWTWITFISIILFIVFVFWGWLSTNERVKQLEDTKPRIAIGGTGFSLEIINLGATAEFEARMSISKENGQPMGKWDFYAGYWQRAKSNRTKIMKTNVDEIVVAELEKTPNQPGLVLSNGGVGLTLNLLEYDFVSKQMNIRKRSSTFITGDFYGQSQTKPEYEIEITVTSEPAMSKIYSYDFKLDISGLHFIEKVELTGK